MRSLFIAAGISLLYSCVTTGVTWEEVTVVSHPPVESSGISFLSAGKWRHIIIKDNDGTHYTYRCATSPGAQDPNSTDAKICGTMAMKACGEAQQSPRENLEYLPCSIHENYSACMKGRGHDDALVSKEYSGHHTYVITYKQLGCSAKAKKNGTSFAEFRDDVAACRDSTGRQSSPVFMKTEIRKDIAFVSEATFESIEAYCKAMKACIEAKGYAADEESLMNDEKILSTKDRFEPQWERVIVGPEFHK